jgi:hypothetical protein
MDKDRCHLCKLNLISYIEVMLCTDCYYEVKSNRKVDAEIIRLGFFEGLQ